MELIRGLHNLRPRHRGCVATIGAFDGVHKGHQAVLRHLRERAAALDVPAVVSVFEPLPREYFAPLDAPARLMSFREKFLALREQGIDRVLRIAFTKRLQSMGAREFVEEVFVAGLGVQHVVVGDDLRFGKSREGDLDLIRELGQAHGFTASPTSTLVEEGERVSSTRIRQALAEAEFPLARRMLGRSYAMSGKVVYGRQLGRELGVPTANLELHRLRSPLSGVFAVEVRGLDRVRFGVANVGTRPTVDENSLKAILEVHLLDFAGDLYGKTIEVVFRHKLREEHKFDSLEELKQQIQRDLLAGRSYFGLT